MIENTRTQLLLPGQRAAPAGPVDLTSMYVMHHAFRRDLLGFRAAAAAAEVADRRRWSALRERWELFARTLHHHHTAEDNGLWPLLLERVGDAGDDGARGVLEAMQAEHAGIDPLLQQCATAFARLAGAPDEEARALLRRRLGEAWVLLDEHLGHEEREAMALVQRHLDQADWRGLEREHFRPAYSPRGVVAVVSWSMAGLPEDVRRAALSSGGPALALLWRMTRRSFARRDALAFGPSIAGVRDTRRPVAVVGATGTTGRLVLEKLVAQGAPVRVLVREARPPGTFPPGVTQSVADLHDQDAVREALRDVRAALYVSPHDPDEEELAANFVRAAEQTGTRIVFSGVHLPVRNPLEWLQFTLAQRFLSSYRGKFRIGQRIAAGSNGPVIFSPTNFFQNDEIVEDDIREGRFPFPMRRVNRVDVRDVAELCVKALLHPSYPAGQHVVAGPASLSGPECARTWARALNRDVRYVGDDDAVWPGILRRRLRGQKLTDLMNTSQFLARRAVVVPEATASTTALLGHAPRTYADYVAGRVEHLTRQPA